MRRFNKAVAYICAAAMLVGSMALTPAGIDAAKKVKLSKTKVTIRVGSTAKISLKNGSKKAKVAWKSGNAKIFKVTKKVAKGNKAYAKVKGMKVGKAKLTATYKLGKKPKKLTCTVTVKKKNNVVKATEAAIATATATAVAATAAPDNSTMPTPVPTPTPVPFNVIDNSKASVMMYIDSKDSEYDGISLIAEAFKADFARVLGIGTNEEGVANESPNGLKVVTDKSALNGRAIIAGTIGDNGNDLVNQLAKEGKIDVSAIEGKWESYKLQVVKNPVQGVSEALVIAGSDKRGTIYGIFRISELMGVSPWV